MEEDSSSPINFAISEVPDAAYTLQPQSLPPERSTTIQEIREIGSLNVSSTAENANIGIVDVDACTKEVDDEPQEKRQKRTTSVVWNRFTKVRQTIEENGKKTVILWAHCNKCKYKARGESTNGTKVFWNHLKKKHNIMPGQQQLKVENKDTVTSVEPYKYDQEASLKKFHLAIIMHEYPFNIVEHEYFVELIKSLRPSFTMKSRITVRKEIQEIFAQEKEKLYEHFKSVNCRFSTTMDMWTSNQNKGYMCVTVHELESYLYNVEGAGVAIDLEKYMVEPPLMVPKSQKFDILSWWKAHQHVYPILSRLARDMLAMQVSTVASESAFSAGGRVIDPSRSRLDPEMVEALVCTKDWLAASRQGSQKNISSILGDLEVLEALATNMVYQVEEEKDSDED